MREIPLEKTEGITYNGGKSETEMGRIIGITCTTTPSTKRYYLTRNYVEAVESAGGIPLLLPPVKTAESLEAFGDMIEGLLLSGGPDIDPVYYGEEPASGTRRIDPEKDKLEYHLAKFALDKGVPVLGICRGCQVLNVVAGGTLHQRIEGLKHWQNAPESYPTHEIEIERGTKLYEMLKAERIRVNTFHRQSVGQVAPGFAVSATARDGVIEGIESQVHPFAVGVQFHAEYLWRDHPVFKSIFSAFVEASGSRGPRARGSSSH
jgi:putative glutamine amidotransferase